MKMPSRPFLALLVLSLVLVAGCVSAPSSSIPTPTLASTPTIAPAGTPTPTPFLAIARADRIPADVAKMTPETDLLPPVLHSSEWEAPVPLPLGVNTAGGEDSPFVTPDGNTLYFFFTPDVRVPVEKQLLDGVTGIWVSTKTAAGWTTAERVVLQDAGTLAGDGCEFVSGNVMWFCSVREGFAGVNLFTARFENGAWRDWQYASGQFPAGFEVGEMHVSADGRDLYFHSPRAGGLGGLDVWVTSQENGAWSEPVNVRAVNSPDNEGWPYLSQDGSELWFTRVYQGSPAVFRSKRANGAWSAPELIVSQFAGEPTLDNAGNLYFVHHYYRDNQMIEADIYLAKKK